jgi:hypothetical protein
MAFTSPLYGCTVTIGTTPTQLLALIHALGGKYANCPGSSRSWNIQTDISNSDYVLAGDENVALSPQQCFYNFGGGGFTFLDRAEIPGLAPIGSIYVVAHAAGQLLNIAVFGE